MPPRVRVRAADVRGAARLATDATSALTDLVEAMHERVARTVGLAAPNAGGRTGGVSGVVYKTIRGVTRVIGGSIDSLLALLAPALPADDHSAEREAVVAALNGVLGDYLAATGNPLAIGMALRRDGRPLSLERAALTTGLPDAGGRLLVLAHGLCMSDLQWKRRRHDHGAALARDLGFTPVYLHYNSGLHISINGRAFADLLERLVDQWPAPLERFVLLGHSMGGLLARSALHYGAQAGHRWPSRLDDLVFLATPHEGAPLERAGNWVDILLGATPYAAPLARLGKVRSAGITDLRHGSLVDEDWVGRDRFAPGQARPRAVALPKGLRCYAIAASLGRESGDLKERLLGDGLVPLASALGRHSDPERALHIPADRQWIGYGMNHLDLLGAAGVQARLRQWLDVPGRPRPRQRLSSP